MHKNSNKNFNFTKDVFIEMKVRNLSIKNMSLELHCHRGTVFYYLKKFNMVKCNGNKKRLDKNCLVCNNFSNRRSICEQCTEKYKGYKKKEDLIKILGNKCLHCNYSDFIGLSFHHIQKKSFGITSYITKNKSISEDLIIELNKCVLLCKNCHLKEHTTIIPNHRQVCNPCKINPKISCKSCNQKQKRHDQKIKAIDMLGGQCTKCPVNDYFLLEPLPGSYQCTKCPVNDYSMLTFHHLDPSLKEVTVSSISNKKWSVVKAEVKKCILLCGNCHQKTHSNYEDFMKRYNLAKEG